MVFESMAGFGHDDSHALLGVVVCKDSAGPQAGVCRHAGHAWAAYATGRRVFTGVRLGARHVFGKAIAAPFLPRYKKA